MRKIVIICGLLALATLPPPQAAARRARPGTAPEIKFVKYQLPNGLEVILHQDKSLPLVAVNVWYHVGAVDERPGRTGFAHLFEHVMFQGSAHVGDDLHFRYLQLAGASQVNGTTGFDRTNYFQTVPQNQLALALWLESDRMGFLLHALTQAKLDKQRLVVKNERRQRYDNRPYGAADEKLCQALFPAPHPYGGCVIGTMADLSAASLGDVKAFFRRYYAPKNATLCLAGDFELAPARALIAKYFGPLHGGAKPKRLLPAKPVHRKAQRIVLRDRVRFPKVIIGWVSPPLFAKGDAELDLLSQVLSHGKSSRLYKELVYKQRLVQDSVSAYQRSAQAGSMFVISALASGEHTAQEVEAGLLSVLQRVAQRGVTAAELKRAKTIQETDTFRALQKVGAKANLLQSYNLYTGNPGYLGRDLARYRLATRNAVQAAARRLVNDQGRVIIHVLRGAK
ncbi:MAG: pitrilysin family protein [bacterium]